MDKLLGVWPASAIVYIVFIVLSAGHVELAVLAISMVFWLQYTEDIPPKFYNYFVWEDKYIFLTVVAHASNLVCIYSSGHILWEVMQYSDLIGGFSDYFMLVFLISTPISTIIHLFYRKKIIAS